MADRDLILAKIEMIGKMLFDLRSEVVSELWDWEDASYEVFRENTSTSDYYLLAKGYSPETGEIIVTAGGEKSLAFGTYISIHRGLPGLPATGYEIFGMKNDFWLKSLLVDDECAPHFAIRTLLVANGSIWNHARSVPATVFAASIAEPIRLDEVAMHGPKIVDKGLRIQIGITNTSDVDRVFRAKIVGKEKKNVASLIDSGSVSLASLPKSTV